MHVVVGSTNPVKVAAVESALERFDPVVTARAVDSGVSAQPRSLEETVEGAQTRAHNASAGSDCAYAVGLESGVARLESLSGSYLLTWAAVTDGAALEVGGGPTMRLPPRVAARVDAGESLGGVMNDVYGRERVGETEGTLGVLSDGLLERRRALEDALACAFGPFVASDRESFVDGDGPE